VKVNDLYLDSKLNIAGSAGIEIEVETRGLDEQSLGELRRKMYPITIKAFNKYSDVLENILQSTIKSDPHFLGGHKKSIYCRVKSNFNSNGEPQSEVYSRDIETTLLIGVDETTPEIGMTSSITLDVSGESRRFELEIDRLVIEEFERYFDPSSIERRLQSIAKANLSIDILQSLPVRRLKKVIIAKKPLPESIHIGGRDITGVFSTTDGGSTATAITIEICYEEEENQRTWCYDYTFGTANV